MSTATYEVSLKKDYKERVVPALMKEFSYKSVMQVPRLEKIVINQGLGIAVADKKIIETAINRTDNHHWPEGCGYHLTQGHFQLQAA